MTDIIPSALSAGYPHTELASDIGSAQNTSRAAEDQQGVRGTLVEVYEPHNQATSQWYVTYIYIYTWVPAVLASLVPLNGGYRRVVRQDIEVPYTKPREADYCYARGKEQPSIPAANPTLVLVELVSALLRTPERISMTCAIAVRILMSMSRALNRFKVWLQHFVIYFIGIKILLIFNIFFLYILNVKIFLTLFLHCKTISNKDLSIK